MSDVIQEAEKVVAAASPAGGLASVVEDAAGDAAKLAAGAAGGVLTGLLPYVLAALGTVILGLAAALWWAHAVTIPRLKAADAADRGALAGANAATAQCNASQDALRDTVQQQNQQIAALQTQAAAAGDRAQAAAESALRKPPPAPPAARSAAAVNAYLQSLRAAP